MENNFKKTVLHIRIIPVGRTVFLIWINLAIALTVLRLAVTVLAVVITVLVASLTV